MLTQGPRSIKFSLSSTLQSTSIVSAALLIASASLKPSRSARSGRWAVLGHNNMKSACVMVFAPTPSTPSSVMVSMPSIVTRVSTPRSTIETLAAKLSASIPSAETSNLILTASWIGVEADDRVSAEVLAEHKQVLAATAVHDIVALTSDKSVATASAA